MFKFVRILQEKYVNLKQPRNFYLNYKCLIFSIKTFISFLINISLIRRSLILFSTVYKTMLNLFSENKLVVLNLKLLITFHLIKN